MDRLLLNPSVLRLYPQRTEPPLMFMISPVVCRDQSESRKLDTERYIIGVATRCSGIERTTD